MIEPDIEIIREMIREFLGRDDEVVVQRIYTDMTEFLKKNPNPTPQQLIEGGMKAAQAFHDQQGSS